jgi:hypothetical protein
MGMFYESEEEYQKWIQQLDDYRFRYCGYTAKSVNWKYVAICVNWTTKSRNPSAFPLCPKCNVINTLEHKHWNEDELKYRQPKRQSYIIIRNPEEGSYLWDSAANEEEARQWYDRMPKGHPDDLFPFPEFSYKPERRKKDQD